MPKRIADAMSMGARPCAHTVALSGRQVPGRIMSALPLAGGPEKDAIGCEPLALV